jgi:beta-phosphoglucomutase
MNTLTRPRDLIYTEWTLTEPEFDPAKLRARETVFTIGNGYLGTRGSFEEGYPNALPITLINGVYDDIPVVYTELANCPDWLLLIVIINGEQFRLDSAGRTLRERGEILSYERRLDLRNGVLSRSIRWRSPIGNTVDLKFERFASLADEQVLAMRCEITPIDFDGTIEVQSSINGYPENQGFDHWEHLDRGKTEQGVWLHVRTRSTQIELGMAAKMTTIDIGAVSQVINTPDCPTLTTTFVATRGQNISVEKVVTVFTSRESKSPVQAAQTKLATLPAYAILLVAHQQAWEVVWQQSDIEIEGDLDAQLAVRYNLFQLFIGGCTNQGSLDTDPDSVPAKTLSGFGYRGHIFWDTEIFILPFFTFTQPAIARSLLDYRYDTLAGARRKATHAGYKGAMFAWESAATGDEMTPKWSLSSDPYLEPVRIWNGEREIHISADIAYAVWQYWQATGDDVWMRDRGAEIILDTALFWLSRVEWHEKQQRYELCGVIGTDEYHEDVRNNAYTNRLVQWHLEKAVAVYEWLQQTFPDRAISLAQQLKLTPVHLLSFHMTIARMYIPYNPQTLLIEQFEGFFALQDIDLSDYEPRTKSIQSVLGMAKTNQSQVIKQPDVLMLLFLLLKTPEFADRQDILHENWNYYTPRTDITQGSSLGSSIQAILAATLDKSADAYEHLMRAALIDLKNTFGNTEDGIHAASAGGVWQALVFGFGGIQLTENGPVATPHLPPNWTRLKFKLNWRGTWHHFNLSPSVAPAIDIRGFIFDVDGVLTDTAEFHYKAWQRLADEEGLPFDRQANEALRGVSRRESLMHIVGDRHYAEKILQSLMERKNRYYVESIETITPKDLFPGAMELLQELRQAGIKIAIGSASKNARTVIKKLGIGNLVDAIADGDSVELPKPAPDLFLFAAKQIGLEPAQCVVVEDATVGVAAAIAAGMRSIGIGPITRVGAASIVLPNLIGVHLVDLQAQLKLALSKPLQPIETAKLKVA